MRQNQKSAAMSARPTMPPTVPPAMAPTLVELPLSFDAAAPESEVALARGDEADSETMAVEKLVEVGGGVVELDVVLEVVALDVVLLVVVVVVVLVVVLLAEELVDELVDEERHVVE